MEGSSHSNRTSMMTITTSRDYREQANALESFIAAARALIDDRTNPEFCTEVAVAAGRASHAAVLGEGLTVARDPLAAGGRETVFDPIINWNNPMVPGEDPLEYALSIAPQILGTLRTKEIAAGREERSLAGRFATVVGFPGRVRQIMAGRGYSIGYQRTGFVTAVAAQVIGALVAWGLTWIAYRALTKG